MRRSVLVWALAVLAASASAETIVVPAARMSDRDTRVVPADGKYDGLAVCHGKGGFEEWTAPIASAGMYYIHVRYCSGQARPCELTLGGMKQPGQVLKGGTGGFLAANLTWETWGPLQLDKGPLKIRLDTRGLMPHFLGLVVSTDKQPPDPTVLPTPKGLPAPNVPPATKAARPSRAPRQPVKEDPPPAPIDPAVLAANREAVRKLIGADEIIFIKRIPYTSNHYYTEYLNSRWTPGGGIFVLSLIDGSQRQIATELQGGVFGRMDLSFDAKKVLFDWKRSQEEGYRIYEVGIDGTGLRQVLPPPTNEAALVERFHLGYHNGTDDMHPCYLADGGIAFVSTRCQASTLCNGADAFTTPVLYRMDADGGNLRRLSFGALSEFTPTLLPDGRIMYARWEYVDKGAVAAKCIWAMRPDGSASEEIYGNDIDFPTTMIQARPIPNAPGQYVFLGCPHYPQNALGTIVRIDMSQPIRTDEPMTYITPEVKLLSEGGWHFQDGASDRMIVDRGGNGPLYRDPWPIDSEHFLAAHKPRGYGSAYAPSGYGLYLVMAPGRVQPFHRETDISCWQPMPLAPRPRPPVMPTEGDAELAARNLARCVVTDVYQGLEGVERGSIRYICVLEQIPRPWGARRPGNRGDDCYDQQYAVVSKDTALGLKVQHGVVPVESDGSAHFIVPANASVFLQVLDENYLAVQTERTFVNFMPGETRSCIGCHETPRSAPAPLGAPPLALRREASLPGPQPGETSARRPLHYPSDVQPVLDRHCIKCHNEKDTQGGLDLTGRPTQFFSVSYENLIKERRRGRDGRREPDLVPTIGENHPKVGNVSYLPPRSLGSHNSVLMALLTGGRIRLEGVDRRARVERLLAAHAGIELSADELVRVATWVDTNAQYYGSYFGHRNLEFAEEPGFRPVPTWESARGERPNAPGV